MDTLWAMLEASADAHAERIAVQAGPIQWTYQQLWQEVNQLSQQFRGQGYATDRPVALLFENTPTCVAAFCALAHIQASVIPVGPETSAYELDQLCESTPFVAVFGSTAQLTRLRRDRTTPPPYRLSNLTQRHAVPSPHVTSDDPPAAPDRPFLYHYTSGSTGKAKAALHEQSALINGGVLYQQTYDVSAADRFLIPIPLAHSFGLITGLITGLLSGARVVLIDRFIPNQIVQTLAAEQITVLLAVPIMYDLIARCSLPVIPALPALRLCLSSGAPLLAEVAQRFQERFQQPIYQVYGSTETGGIAAQRPAHPGAPPQSIGRMLPGVEARIVDEHGQLVAPGASGMLLVKTPGMFAGYFDHPDATARAFQDGWYVTGDTARLDAEGWLSLVGRKDTFINVGGKKVNPMEIEEVLLSFPSVSEAVAFGRDVGPGGEQVQAVVVVREVTTEDALIAFCRRRLAAYKVPAQIDFLSELPKTSLGKVRRALWTQPNDTSQSPL